MSLIIVTCKLPLISKHRENSESSTDSLTTCAKIRTDTVEEISLDVFGFSFGQRCLEKEPLRTDSSIIFFKITKYWRIHKKKLKYFLEER